MFQPVDLKPVLMCTDIPLKSMTTDRHPFNGLFSMTARVSWHQKG